MFWVMVTMVPLSLLIGVLSGMREGTRLDRSLSTFAIASTATPEYVSGVILIVIFSSKLVGPAGRMDQWQDPVSAPTPAMDGVTFENFFLPVMPPSPFMASATSPA